MKYFGNDSIMENWSFLISGYLENIGALRTYQFFLTACEQLTKVEVKESQATASVRIY